MEQAFSLPLDLTEGVRSGMGMLRVAARRKS